MEKVKIKTNEDVNAFLEIFYRACIPAEDEFGSPGDYTGIARQIHAAISASDGKYLELTRDQVHQMDTDLVGVDDFVRRVSGAFRNPEFRQID